MTRVFVEANALNLDSEQDRSTGSIATDEAARALMHLIEAGYDLVFVGSSDAIAPGLMTAFRSSVAEIPDDAAGWLVTADPARCGPSRPEIRTLLVGGAEGARPTQRCDSAARNLMGAAIEILASEAMSGSAAGHHS